MFSTISHGNNRQSSHNEQIKALGFIGLGIASAFMGIFAHKTLVRRIKNADMISVSMIERQVTIRGVITRVGDADNFRMYHRPLLSLDSRSSILQKKLTAVDTIHVRLAGVDAPETSHFGKPAQPYANEALQWLKQKITGEKVAVKLLRKDRYGRVIRVGWKCTALREMVQTVALAGYGAIYEQDGAEYDGMLDKLRRVEEQARRKKRGMWKQKHVELPSTYKKKLRG
ncbi:hypothetical protein E3Q23_04132 [Wallemia mellicola]|uniref:SNase-domain-containing protein n=1 Tax=Wallemia mellicola TaxID=1708541 RepID=A0A4T0TAS7_9BASI|nr:hypothetical protein E3Q23_04132 [Wallemia mellicola]TIC62106.1 SNase-domain-containing protein [Wallemia mellicola]